MVEAACEWFAGRLHLFFGGATRHWERRGSAVPLLKDRKGN